MKKIILIITITLLFLITLSSIGQTIRYGTEYSPKGQKGVRYIRNYKTNIDDFFKHYTTTYITNYSLYPSAQTGVDHLFLTFIVEHFKTEGFVAIYIGGVLYGVSQGKSKYYEIYVKDFNGLTYKRIQGGKLIIDIGFVSSKKEHIKIYKIRENTFNRCTYKLDKK